MQVKHANAGREVVTPSSSSGASGIAMRLLTAKKYLIIVCRLTNGHIYECGGFKELRTLPAGPAMILGGSHRVFMETNYLGPRPSSDVQPRTN